MGRLYPFESHYLDVGGLRYHYLDEGRGEPVVMVHGNPTWSFYFRELVKGLRDSYRCVVPDHIGCGLSEKPGDDRYDYTLSRRADDLGALLDHLGLDRGVTLLMHDWGGMIGMVCAMRRPERIARLAALNTAAFLKPAGKKMPWPLWVVHRRNWLSALLVQGLNAFSVGATISATARGMSREVRRCLTAPYDCWPHRIATLRFVQDAPLRPSDRSYGVAKKLDESVHQFTDRPTLVCWGERDWVFDHRFLEEWRRRFPRAEVHTFPNAGHYVLEDEAGAILPLVREFLKRNPVDHGKAPVDAPMTRPNASTVQSAPTSAVVEQINVAAYLPEMARQVPDRPAIAWVTGRSDTGAVAYAHWTFRQLNEETDRFAHGLEEAGVTRGMRTILMVRPCPEFFALVFALFKVGAVVVLIDPGMGRRRMVECLGDVTAEAFIGIPLAQVLRTLHPAAFRSVRIRVTVGRRWFWGGMRLSDVRAMSSRPYEMAPTRRDDPAAIIFTTGSTGPPKGVLYQHGMFDAQVRILRDHLGIAPGEIDLPTFPLFALFDPALGMTAVIPEMDPTRPAWVDPEKIIGAIRDWKVTNMFGSPALLDRVGRYGQANGVKLPTLRRVVSAGAPASPAVLERFAAMLDGDAEIHTPYGATESLPVASIGSREILAETRHETQCGGGTCVGRPMPGVEVRIIEITEQPIERWSEQLVSPPGQIGEIVVKGPMVSPEYCTDAAATGMAKIPDGDAVWHRMGDVGRFDGRGRLWFCGRKAHRVVTEQGTLFTIPCEAIFNRHPTVFRSALVGVGERPRQRPVLCVELEAGHKNADQAKLTQELLRIGQENELTRSIGTVLFHPGFPVDIRHNAKIFREKLAVWAAGKLKAR